MASGTGGDWPALAAATAHDPSARLPLIVAGRPVGSVARRHLSALAAWPQWLQVDPAAVRLDADPAALSGILATIHAALYAQGLIRAWRDEPFTLFDPATLEPLATIERGACRFWGALTLGAHCTGWVADAAGRPSRLWIAQRSSTKATDPGKLDNLVGGGVAAGQAPAEALVREGWEEAGLGPQPMRGARAGSVLRVHRDIREGLQHEWLYTFDLELPAGLVPCNQDGEVAGFTCLPLAEALALAAGDPMTVDAALVTLDFALRHALLGAADARRLGPRLHALRVQPPFSRSESPRQAD